MRQLVLCLAAGLLAALAAPSKAQGARAPIGSAADPVRAFPFEIVADVAGSAGVPGLLLEPTGELFLLAGLDRVRLAGVPLPSGAVELELERVSLATADAQLVVDGAVVDGGPGAMLGDLLLFSGRVAGRADSSAFLALSGHGTRGWIRTPDELVHLLAEPDPVLGWSRPRTRIATEEALTAIGGRPELACRTLPIPGGTAPGASPAAGRPALAPVQPAAGALPGVAAVGTGQLLACRIAMTTDYQYYQIFNDLDAARTYALSIIGAVSDRYREQIQVVLTLPYLAFYTTSFDPWTWQDIGGSCIDVLYEMQYAWSSGMPAEADLGHMLSGADLGCGVAYLDALCIGDYGYSVSGNMSGATPLPVAVGPLNWDFIVLAHEVGHNFDALHTHDYCPPLDECAPAGYFGFCQTAEVCSDQGTIMSYCHLCGAGMDNMTTYFHPQSVADMRAAAEGACLLPFEGVFTAELGASLAGSAGTPELEIGWDEGTNALTFGWSGAPGGGPGYLVLGTSTLFLPILGGTLVPSPDLVAVFPVPTAAGNFNPVPIANPHPSGMTFWAQLWLLDIASPNLVAATSGWKVEMVVPTPPAALTWFQHPSNGKDYALSSTGTWFHARGEGKLHGGSLARIPDAALETWLKTTFYDSGLVSGDVWIGFTDNFSEGTFYWVGGGSAAYTHWNSGQPNDLNFFQDSVEWQGPSGGWGDLDGFDVQRGILERPHVGP